MALPKLLQKLFDNLGLGPKLRKDIIPTDINVDSATKASQDAVGNVIDKTYLKSTDASSTFLSKIDASNEYLKKTGKASSAASADSATKATSADKLSTARTISLTNQVTGSGSFDGSGNLSITATLADSGVAAGGKGPGANATIGLKYNASGSGKFLVPYFVVDAKGRVTSAVNRTITISHSCSDCSNCSEHP